MHWHLPTNTHTGEPLVVEHLAELQHSRPRSDYLQGPRVCFEWRHQTRCLSEYYSLTVAPQLAPSSTSLSVPHWAVIRQSASSLSPCPDPLASRVSRTWGCSYSSPSIIFFSFFLAGAQHAQFLHVSAVTVALQLAACSCSCCSRPRADGCKREGDKNNSNECSHVNSSVSVHWHIMWWGETLYMHGWKQEVFTVFLYFNGLLACM